MKIRFADSTSDNSALHIVPVAKDSLPASLPQAVKDAAERARFAGKGGQVLELFHDGERMALVGTGDDNKPASFEKAGGAVVAKYWTSGEKVIALDVSESGLDGAQIASILLGMRSRNWRHERFRTKLKDDQKRTLETIEVVGGPADAADAWEIESAVADGMDLTRHLVAEPANTIYPETFVDYCREAYAGTGLEITVLDKDQMTALGMGSLLGVAQGSVREPRLLCVKWSGGAADEAPTAFVGKGVTFDTGGISLKPGPGMGDMKFDMGGAGAVAGAMLTLAKRKAKANVIGVCGLVENMPDAAAQRPGDVVTSMSGQTIEVLNTDAEGRLVLADALHWVQVEHKPARIIDFATLTGAMIIALGSEHGGLFSNNDELAEDLLSAGIESGDKLWRFPLSPAYDKLLDSPIADMQNIGPKGAGSITAAQFIQRFIMDDTPWAHCDIAGMVWAEKPGATWDKGATGYGVRLIDRFIRDTVES